MIKFEDLTFGPCFNPRLTGEQAIFYFDNNRGVSVVRSDFSYGGDQGMYEAVEIRWCGPFQFELMSDVTGYLTPEQVTDYMKELQEKPPREHKIH